MKPKKGDILLTTGLFDPIFARKEVKFVREIKKRGEPVKWKTELLEPIYGITEITNTQSCFFWLGESKLPEWARGKLETLNEQTGHVAKTCCNEYNTPFCPICGSKIA